MADQQQFRTCDKYVDPPSWTTHIGPSSDDDTGAAGRGLADFASPTNLHVYF